MSIQKCSTNPIYTSITADLVTRLVEFQYAEYDPSNGQFEKRKMNNGGGEYFQPLCDLYTNTVNATLKQHSANITSSQYELVTKTLGCVWTEGLAKAFNIYQFCDHGNVADSETYGDMDQLYATTYAPYSPTDGPSFGQYLASLVFEQRTGPAKYVTDYTGGYKAIDITPVAEHIAAEVAVHIAGETQLEN